MCNFTEAAIAFGSALAGACAGAFLANHLERISKRRDKDRSNISATNRALIVLWQHWYALEDYRATHGENWGTKGPHAWYTASVPYPRDIERFEVDLPSLDFLLETDYAEVVARISQVEEYFRVTKALIERRATYFFERVFPRLDTAKIPYGGTVPEDQVLINALGFQLVDELKKMYPEMIERTDECITNLRALITDLRENVIQHYPKFSNLIADYDLTYTVSSK